MHSTKARAILFSSILLLDPPINHHLTNRLDALFHGHFGRLANKVSQFCFITQQAFEKKKQINSPP
jgi:hypothetical protein